MFVIFHALGENLPSSFVYALVWYSSLPPSREGSCEGPFFFYVVVLPHSRSYLLLDCSSSLSG